MPYSQLNVAASPYRVMQNRFTTHVRHKDGLPLNKPQLEMGWSEFKKLFSQPVQPLDGLAVKVHFGLQGHDMVLGFSQVHMSRTANGEYALSVLDHWLVSGGVFVTSTQTIIDGLVKNYLDNVEVKRTPSSGFTALVPGVDPQSAITPYELELLPLYDQNQQRTGGGLQEYRVVISCLFDQEVGGGDLKHSIGYHLRFNDHGTWRDLLDDVYVTPASYVNKAADFSNPCPPGCAAYRAR